MTEPVLPFFPPLTTEFKSKLPVNGGVFLLIFLPSAPFSEQTFPVSQDAREQHLSEPSNGYNGEHLRQPCNFQLFQHVMCDINKTSSQNIMEGHAVTHIFLTSKKGKITNTGHFTHF